MVTIVARQLVLWWDDTCETHDVLGSDSDLANDSYCCCLVAWCLATFSSAASSMEILAVNVVVVDSDLISVVVHHLDGDSD
jgi:hypothetical protein